MSEIAGVGSLLGDIFGSKGTESGSTNATGTSNTKAVQTTQLEIGQDAINKIIADVLGSATGMKDIFSQENVAGIFDGSTAQQLAGDLTSKIVGEIAKLLAKEVTATEEDVKTTGTQNTESNVKDKGLVGGLVDGIKSIF